MLRLPDEPQEAAEQRLPLRPLRRSDGGLGRKFKPPKRSDRVQWRKVRLLYEGGYWDHRWASWRYDAQRNTYSWIPPVETLREARDRVRLETDAQLLRRLLSSKKRAKARSRPPRKGGKRYRQAAGAPLSF